MTVLGREDTELLVRLSSAIGLVAALARELVSREGVDPSTNRLRDGKKCVSEGDGS